MKRRSFLMSAASLLPAAAASGAFLDNTFAQPAAPAPASQLHIVGPSEDRLGKPHSLGFSTFYFKVTSAETQGRLFLLEHRQMTQGGPNLHLHLNQEEWFYVIEGEIAFQIGEQRLRLGPGESVLAPRRVQHTFSSAGATPGRMMIGFCPAGKMEQFFLDKTDPASPKRSPGFYETVDIGPSPFWKA